MSLRAADGWRVETVAFADAVGMIKKYHYTKSAANTAVARHGLIAPSGDLMGAILWMPPTKVAARTVDAAWRSVLTCSRLVIHPQVPTNGASFLLGRSMSMIDRSKWATLLTYADTKEGHTGAIYLATNWTQVGPVAAGDTWTHSVSGEQRGRKRGPTSLSVSEMLAAGYVRSRPLPKIKFAHWSKHSAIPDRPELRNLTTKKKEETK